MTIATQPATVTCTLTRGRSEVTFRAAGEQVTIVYRVGRESRSFDVMERSAARAHYRSLVRSGYRPPQAFTAPQGA